MGIGCFYRPLATGWDLKTKMAAGWGVPGFQHFPPFPMAAFTGVGCFWKPLQAFSCFQQTQPDISGAGEQVASCEVEAMPAEGRQPCLGGGGSQRATCRSGPSPRGPQAGSDKRFSVFSLHRSAPVGPELGLLPGRGLLEGVPEKGISC